jgi:hypothetical protein
MIWFMNSVMVSPTANLGTVPLVWTIQAPTPTDGAYMALDLPHRHRNKLPATRHCDRRNVERNVLSGVLNVNPKL